MSEIKNSDFTGCYKITQFHLINQIATRMTKEQLILSSKNTQRLNENEAINIKTTL